MLIAEDSTACPGVTKGVDEGGLGFDYKWDLGWMHDTLKYLQCHPYDRAGMPDKITFSIFYGYNERYILPFSHDEAVHGKKTIVDQLYGTYQQKFAQAKLLYLYMMTHPGKKLNFMGNELAMFREWDEKREPDWELVKMPAHDSFHRDIGELNHLYLRKKAVWQLDHAFTGFKWVDCCCANKCVFGYTRTDEEQILLALLHFSDQEAAVSPEIDGKMTLLLNTDRERFGGKTAESVKPSIPSMLLPFTGILFECQASGAFESMKKP